MPKRLVLTALTLFAAQTAGRNMTKAAYVAVTVGVTVMVLLTAAPNYEVAHRWVGAVLWACWAYFLFEWAVRLRHAAREPALVGLHAVVPRRGGRRRRDRNPAGVPVRRRTAHRLATRDPLGTQAGAGYPRSAAVAPGAGGRIRTAIERAGDLPDGAVPGLGRGLFLRARRPARHLRQRARGALVGGRDPDHDRLWRRGADHALRPHRCSAGDDLRARRVRAVDRYSRDRFRRRDPARQFPQDLGIRQQGAVLRRARARRRSPTSRICCAPWTCRRAP